MRERLQAVKQVIGVFVLRTSVQMIFFFVPKLALVELLYLYSVRQKIRIRTGPKPILVKRRSTFRIFSSLVEAILERK